MTPDAPTPVDAAPIVASSSKKRCWRFCLYNAFLSCVFVILLVVLIPRWFPQVGDWLFPYVKNNQIEKWQSQLSSLTLTLQNAVPKDKQESEDLKQRLHALEERLQKNQVAPAESKGDSKKDSSGEQSYFMEVLLLCQEIEVRLLNAQDYQAPLALLTALLKTPEEQAWLNLLNNNTPTTNHADTPTEGITTNWPWWLKPIQNFFTIQPLTDKTPSVHVDKRAALQKLKDVAIANYQKASLAGASRESVP